MKIGIFDSGLGGLTVLQAILKQIKGVEIFYIADTLHAPYGNKTPQQILDFSLRITQYFISTQHIDVLVIACNTATSAAISALRQGFPELIIVGTEPAIKPAIEQSMSAKVGVLATPATLQGDKYQSLADRLSTHKEVALYEQACAGLVEHIENNTLESPESQALLEKWLAPMRESGVDTIVLGCTHYPLATDAMAKVMQKEVVFLESGGAIAKRLYALMKAKGHLNRGSVEVSLYATGKIDTKIVSRLLPRVSKVEKIAL
jgi:glutamate racemase